MSGVALESLVAPDRLDRLDGHDRAEPLWRTQARATAIDWLSANPMPTRHDEGWRYTSVDKLIELVASTSRARRGLELDSRQVDLFAGDHGGSRLVFVNGRFAPGASRLRPDVGVSSSPFSSLDRDSAPELPVEPSRMDGFVAFNRLAGDDGAFIRISAETDARTPIHIVHVVAPHPEAGMATHPASVVHLEPGARCTVVESFVGFAGTALTNASTVIDVGNHADLTYHRVQDEHGAASHVGHVRIRVGQAARLHATSFSLGAATSRVALDISADGDGSRIEVDGLYLPSGDEHHDHVITVEHVGSHTTSEQRFKGVIDDRARGSFTGQVIVRPGTVDTSASQTNHSLLLTRTAESDSRPWLEILADDVRCTHGATVGRLDDEALFYLRSRGIPEPDARRVLIDAFASEIVESVADESLRDHLNARIRAKGLRER